MLLRQSWRIVRARAGAMLALGAGIVLSLFSLCCGIGVVTAPWLLCELLALQLGELLGRPLARGGGWVSAAAILLGAVMLTASVGWLTWLGLGTEIAPSEHIDPTLWARLSSGGGLLASVSALVTLAFVLPFLYAPLLLLESRAGIGGAILESARLVSAGGVLRHYALSLGANALQLAPVLAAALLSALLTEDETGPLWIALTVPVLALSVPLGQGLVVSAYAARRDQICDARASRSGRPPASLIALWALVVAGPMLSAALLGASLVRPSRPQPSQLVSGQGEELVSFAPLRKVERVYPRGTALALVLGPARVEITASDGGGAGRLPLYGKAPLESARVVRVRDRYAIELVQSGETFVTWIDRAGVRLDDDLRARLLDRVPSWALLTMLGILLAIASMLLPVLGGLGEVRRLYASETAGRSPPPSHERLRARTHLRAYLAGALLLPLAGFSLYWGLRSLF